MNIQQARQQILETVKIYLSTDEYGNYLIPVEHQRPIFMIGAPGIGKTAIMEQIARELDLPLLAYSMTHHTRQSAIGLPRIAQRNYRGQLFHVTEYTLSEIIAAVYETMEQTGKSQGILFLDEVNCVSETLGPTMLQFLQYKTFGNHRIPEGWVIVTAGNPPEYNRSVREFDIATLDRLKILSVTPDYMVWKSYAVKKGLHPAVITYLDIHQDHFYRTGMTDTGRSYVTARGWEDLSDAIRMYEEKKFPVDESLIGQYLQDDEIREKFMTYYALYDKYRSDYQIFRILEASEDEEILARAKQSGPDERITVLGLLREALFPQIRAYMRMEQQLRGLFQSLKRLQAAVKEDPNADLPALLEEEIGRLQQEIRAKEASSGILLEEKEILQYQINFCRGAVREIQASGAQSSSRAFSIAASRFNQASSGHAEKKEAIRSSLQNTFRFLEQAYGDGEEMLMFVTDLTRNPDTSSFIARYGSDEYYAHSKKLMLDERAASLLQQIRAEKEGE